MGLSKPAQKTALCSSNIYHYHIVLTYKYLALLYRQQQLVSHVYYKVL